MSELRLDQASVTDSEEEPGPRRDGLTKINGALDIACAPRDQWLNSTELSLCAYQRSCRLYFKVGMVGELRARISLRTTWLDHSRVTCCQSMSA